MNTKLLSSLTLASFVAAASVAAAPADDTEERITRSAEGRTGDHAADELRDPTSFVVTRRAASEIAQKPRSTRADNRVRATAAASYGDSWIYDAYTDLFLDLDNDGYYHRLRVTFDADTLFTYSFVYAEIYISADGSAWEHLYTTADFEIRGTDPDDDYEVETDLVSGYSTGLYDVLIELYDADTGELVDEFGPNESPEFSLLPLEDSTRDGVVIVVPPDDGGGGAVHWLALPGLLAAFLRRKRR